MTLSAIHNCQWSARTDGDVVCDIGGDMTLSASHNAFYDK